MSDFEVTVVWVAGIVFVAALALGTYAYVTKQFVDGGYCQRYGTVAWIKCEALVRENK